MIRHPEKMARLYLGKLEDWEFLLLVQEEVKRRIQDERFDHVNGHECAAEVSLLCIHRILIEY